MEKKMGQNNIPNEFNIIWEEAKTYIEKGDYDKAIEIYKYVLIRYCDNAIAARYANAYLGDIYLTLKDPEVAQICIRKAINADPEEPSYRYQMGFAYSLQHKWKKAIMEFEIAIAKDPNNGEYLRGLGWAIYNGGNTVKGLTYLRRASEKEPKNVNILNDLAVVYLGLLDFKNAEQCISKVLLIDPGNDLAKETLDQIDFLWKRHSRENPPNS
jgi:tetratricopeptide (TPR) repeat protein